MYKGQVDYIAGYCKELDKVYLMPIDNVGVNAISLRIDKPKNGLRYKMAIDFEI
jgi:hypothetical protein